MPTERDYLEEALLILRGASSLLPERQHLIALNESREAWRRVASGRDPVLAHALAAHGLTPARPQRRAS